MRGNPVRLLRAAYLAVGALTTVTGAAAARTPHAVAKTSLMPFLCAELVADRRSRADGPLLTALVASGVGDVVLLGDDGDPDAQRRRLRCGAGAFAVTQLTYVVLLAARGDRPRWRAAVPVCGSLLAAAVLDSDDQGGLDPWLTSYGVLLGATGVLGQDDAEGRVRAGSALFVLSDLTILLRSARLRGGSSRALAEGAVLATYAAAQRLLVDGLRTTPGLRATPGSPGTAAS